MQGTAKIMEKINSLTFQVQNTFASHFLQLTIITLHSYPDVDSFIVANLASTSIARPSLTDPSYRKSDTTWPLSTVTQCSTAASWSTWWASSRLMRWKLRGLLYFILQFWWSSVPTLWASREQRPEELTKDKWFTILHSKSTRTMMISNSGSAAVLHAELCAEAFGRLLLHPARRLPSCSP